MMNRFYIISLLCLLVWSGNLNAKRQSEDDWDRGNSWERNSRAREYSDKDPIYIDERPQGDDTYFSGGGDDRMNDDLDMEMSGDGWSEEEGSAEGETQKSLCQRLREELDGRKLIGAYMPRCTEDGGFEKLQCHGSTGECWCVDDMGREIPGSKLRAPGRPDCENIVIDHPRNKNFKEDTDPIIVEPTYQGKPATEFNNVIPNMPGNENGNVEIETLMPPHENNQVMMESHGEDPVHSPVMSEPGILAGIIGGAVVGLLCAVLLVMFIVYRMRKKDEGSYALDEPKRSPTHHAYTRANTREFYA